MRKKTEEKGMAKKVVQKMKIKKKRNNQMRVFKILFRDWEISCEKKWFEFGLVFFLVGNQNDAEMSKC